MFHPPPVLVSEGGDGLLEPVPKPVYGLVSSGCFVCCREGLVGFGLAVAVLFGLTVWLGEVFLVVAELSGAAAGIFLERLWLSWSLRLL